MNYIYEPYQAELQNAGSYMQSFTVIITNEHLTSKPNDPLSTSTTVDNYELYLRTLSGRAAKCRFLYEGYLRVFTIAVSE